MLDDQFSDLPGESPHALGKRLAPPTVSVPLLVLLQAALESQLLRNEVSDLKIKLQAAERRTGVAEQRADAAEEAGATDELTGLVRSGSIKAALRKAHAEVVDTRNPDRKLSIIFGDVDHFKQVNDEYGHLAGDAALQMVGKVLGEGKRQSDALGLINKDESGRYAGDEFLILLPECGLENATAKAEKLRAQIAETPLIADTPEGKKTFSITVTLGVATFDVFDPDSTYEKFLDRADQALYAAKHYGKNCVCANENGEFFAYENSKLIPLPSLPKERDSAAHFPAPGKIS